MTTLSTTIAGIPCQIRVTSYNQVKGSYSRNADSDQDFYGYTDCEWDVLDRKGYAAPWLARKMTDRDTARIDQLIAGYMK